MFGISFSSLYEKSASSKQGKVYSSTSCKPQLVAYNLDSDANFSKQGRIFVLKSAKLATAT